MKMIQNLWKAVCLWCMRGMGKPSLQNGKREPQPVSGHLQTYLAEHYRFRFNVLTDETEYRPADGSAQEFTPLSRREQNSICLDAHAAGVYCWDRDVDRYVNSGKIDAYHPFKLYFDELPEWDGVDRIRELARRVSGEDLWLTVFPVWLRAVAAQWMGVTGNHANAVAPILISSRQGMLKSTFCKSLLPDVLQRYYTDSIDLALQGQTERKLAEMGLLNLDEFDKISPKKMALLKNLMQMPALNLRKAYQKNFRQLPRIASFIGTSNRTDLLTDPTGSRRFICVTVDHKIDCSGIEHAQIYAQLKQEVESGMRYWFTGEEEAKIQQHNSAYYRQSFEDDVFSSCFRIPENIAEATDFLSAADIYQVLRKHNPAVMRHVNTVAFSQSLAALGLKRKHTKWGNVYPVVKL